MNHENLNDIEDLKFMPVRSNKQPIEKDWQKTTKKFSLKNCEAVGLVCGKLSGNLEVIDVDEKYSLDGKLFERYKKVIHQYDPALLQKLVVQKTISGGYHLIYRCQKIEGNLKLANRFTTDAEKRKTYDAEIKGGADHDKALKAANGDKIRVLLETRGEGGFVVCFPSKGYELIYGDYYGINEITIEERETLHNIARQFNEVVDEYKPITKTGNRQGIKGLSPFDDYNDRADIVGLLETHGWKVVQRKGNKVVFLRPGQTSSQSSGNYDLDKNWFSVFTTSTDFEPQKAYLPYAVYAKLECKDDFKEAAKKLYNEGYGERHEVVREINTKTPSKISVVDDDLSFLENLDEYDEYLDLSKRGLIPKGLATGMPTLDEHFLFKRGDMVMINGVDNVGKTIVIIFLMLLAAMHHGWNFLIFSTENTNKNLYKRLIEFYWGKQITAMNDVEIKVAKEFIKNHFIFIKSDEDLFNYKDILNMAKKVMTKFHFDAGLIDPYNSLKIEITNTSKLNTHEYHYEAISEIKQFGSKYDISWFINNHAVTSALRTKDTDGFQKAPGKEDTEGGGKFSNKAAQFITVHRLTQHPQEWMVTQLHIRKVKETETGGKVTPRDLPVKLVMNKNRCGFSEHIEGGGFGTDPVFDWHNKIKKPKEIEFEKPTIWMPYKDDNGDEPIF